MNDFIKRISEIEVGGEPLVHIIWCVAIIVFALVLKRPLAAMLTKLIGQIANKFSDKKYAETFKELLIRPLELLLVTVLFYIALNQLTVLLNSVIFDRLSSNGKSKYAIHLIDAIDKIFLLFIIIFFTLVISRITDFIFHTLIQKAKDEDHKEREQLFPLLKDVAKILLWTMGLFWILGSVFNVNIPALITGLGIGGVAIALAAKESVENFFASFTILTDKPFSTGDSIRLGSQEGKVEKVGFRSTRLRGIDGSLFVIPNKNLIGNSLENLSERNGRRVKISVHMPYGVTYDRLQSMVASLETMLQQSELIIYKEEVILDSFNESSFIINVIYYLPDPLPEGTSLNVLKHDLNMKIYETIEKYLPDGVQKYQLIDATNNESSQQ